MKKEEKKVMKVLVETMKEMLSVIKYGIVEELDKIAVIVQIVFPVILVYFQMGVLQTLLLSMIFTFVIKYIKEVSYKLNNVNERGFPISNTRYTNVDDNGFISIKEELQQESVLYLYEIEEYLKKKGLLKGMDK